MAGTDTNLYRSYKNTKRTLGRGSTVEKTKVFTDAEGEGSLYPNMGFTRRDGTIRPADISTEVRDGTTYVPGVGDGSREGVSVSKTCGGFGYNGWCYFLLPAETEIPKGLDIAHTPSRRDNGHYSIRCRNRMTLEAYEGALDNLARNAIAKCVELKIPVLYFDDPKEA